MCAKSLQFCSPFCDLMNGSLPGSSVHGILQARIVEWIAMLSSKESSQPRDQTHISYISCMNRQILYEETSGEPSNFVTIMIIKLHTLFGFHQFFYQYTLPVEDQILNPSLN